MSTSHLFAPVIFLGVGVLAVWTYVCLPRLRPRTLSRAIVHVGASLLLFHAAPAAVVGLSSVLPPWIAFVLGVGAVTIPGLAYVFVSWIWLLARIIDSIDATPRSGLPTRTKA